MRTFITYQIREDDRIIFETESLAEAEEILIDIYDDMLGTPDLEDRVVIVEVSNTVDDRPHSFIFDDAGNELDVDSITTEPSDDERQATLDYGEATYPDYGDH